MGMMPDFVTYRELSIFTGGRGKNRGIDENNMFAAIVCRWIFWCHWEAQIAEIRQQDDREVHIFKTSNAPNAFLDEPANFG